MNDKFYGIWYRQQALKSRTKWKDVFNRDSGVLTITPLDIEYNGRKNHFKLLISQIESIEFGRQGVDTVNAWIKISYSEDNELKEAHFMDGKFFGYSGVFGGTKRMFKLFQRLLPDSKIKRFDESHVAFQLTLLFAMLYAIYRISLRC